MTLASEPGRGNVRPAGDSTEDEELEPSGGELDTHTAALQGAAAGGAMGGNAGYAGGLFTGSEDDIGVREIPDDRDEDAD